MNLIFPPKTKKNCIHHINLNTHLHFQNDINVNRFQYEFSRDSKAINRKLKIGFGHFTAGTINQDSNYTRALSLYAKLLNEIHKRDFHIRPTEMV